MFALSLFVLPFVPFVARSTATMSLPNMVTTQLTSRKHRRSESLSSIETIHSSESRNGSSSNTSSSTTDNYTPSPQRRRLAGPSEHRGSSEPLYCHVLAVSSPEIQALCFQPMPPQPFPTLDPSHFTGVVTTTNDPALIQTPVRPNPRDNKMTDSDEFENTAVPDWNFPAPRKVKPVRASPFAARDRNSLLIPPMTPAAHTATATVPLQPSNAYNRISLSPLDFPYHEEEETNSPMDALTASLSTALRLYPSPRKLLHDKENRDPQTSLGHRRNTISLFHPNN